MEKAEKKKRKRLNGYFEKLASSSTRFAGSAGAFIIAFFIILIWGMVGPIFHFSETWQIVINTATTIITFLIVFLIQHSQNKDSLAIQLKLDEIISSLKNADNRLISIEDLSEEELKELQKYYQSIVADQKIKRV